MLHEYSILNTNMVYVSFKTLIKVNIPTCIHVQKNCTILLLDRLFRN